MFSAAWVDLQCIPGYKFITKGIQIFPFTISYSKLDKLYKYSPNVEKKKHISLTALGRH